MVGAVVATMPVLAIFLWLEKFIVPGLTTGSVKKGVEKYLDVGSFQFSLNAKLAFDSRRYTEIVNPYQ